MSTDSREDHPPGFHRVFRVSRPWKYMPASLAVIGAALTIVWIAAPDQPPFLLALLAGLMLIGLGIGLWVNSQLRLEVSDSEIVFRAWGYSVRSRWDNLLGYSRRSMGLFTVETLIPRTPGTQFHPLVEFSLRMLRWTSLRGGSHGLGLSDPDWVGIPVGLFAENWRESDLGRLVQQYAPTAYNTPVM